MSEDLTMSMSEGEMNIGEFKTKGFRLYSLALLSLIGVAMAIVMKVDPAYIAVLATISANIIGVFTGKKA